jgi:hypothetical protein
MAALLAVAALVYFFAIRDDGETESTTGELPGRSQPVTGAEDDLDAVAESVGHDVYWAGPQDNATIEVTKTKPSNVFIRYLTEGAEAGDPEPNFLSVGTYPVKDALGALEAAAKKDGAITAKLDRGGLAVTNSEDQSSVYVAYPDSNLQIEVYAPDPDMAFDIATSGTIEPVS